MTETILGGILIAVVSGAIGKSLSERKMVNRDTCNQIRGDCRDLLCTKIDNVAGKLDALTEAVNHKLYGL